VTTATFRCTFCAHVHSDLDEVYPSARLCIQCYELGVAHADPELLATEEKGQGNRGLGLSG
jgi:hypothetical protein